VTPRNETNAPEAPEAASKTVALPRLNGITPTLESTALKLMEEAGELSAAITRFRALTDDPIMRGQAARRVARELLDVAQTAVTMMFVLEEEHGIDLEQALSAHIEKLLSKGYLKL